MLYILLSLPLVELFGTTQQAAMSVNLFFGAVLQIGTFGMGRILHGARVGLLAAFLVVCYPPIVEVTRFFSPHAALPACIAVSLWTLLGLVKGPTVRKAWLFAVSLAFGMLLHPSFAWSLAVPTAVGASYVAFFVRPPRRPLSLATTPAWLGCIRSARDSPST